MKKRTMAAGALCAAALAAAPAWADTIQLSGIIRDFKRGDQSGGHPDFQTAGAMGRFGHVINLVTLDIGGNNKPVYHPTRPAKDTIQSAGSLTQWYSDVIGVNAAGPLTLTLNNGQSTPGGVYSYSSNAFWPIDGQFFGNQGLNHNFHFTYELHTNFTYSPGQKFTFIGDDDVWVYVNGKRVIDIGGVHSAVTGSVLLFDGKAWVTKAHFVTGGDVKQVTTDAEVAALVQKWNDLGMTGTCPILKNDRYIDLQLNGAGNGDTRAAFNATQVMVYAADTLTSAVVTFTNGAQQTFTGLSGHSALLAGSGANAGKTVTHVQIYAGANTAGQLHASNGATGINAKLDFFFAERHTTQSNFRIDTTMNLNTVPPTTISPLYD